MKTSLILVIFALAVTLMTGCIQFEIGLDVNEDLSGMVQVVLAVNPLLAGKDQFNLAEIKVQAESNGYQAEPYEEAGRIGYKFSKKVKHIKELVSENDKGMTLQGFFAEGADSDKLLKVKKGLLKDVYTIKTMVDLREIVDETGEMWDLNDLTPYLHFKFKVNLPVSVESTNAVKIENEGKSMEWQLIPGQENEIYLQMSMVNKVNVIILIIVMLGLLVGVGLIIGRRKSKRESIMA